MKGKKTGGRTAGTPNKISANESKNVADFLSRYKSGTLVDSDGNPISFDVDFGKMSPTDRVLVATRLQALITPKPIELDLNTDAAITIEDKLTILASDNN